MASGGKPERLFGTYRMDDDKQKGPKSWCLGCVGGSVEFAISRARAKRIHGTY